MKEFKRGLCWLRRDLRLEDNTALHQALTQCDEVLICFIFDEQILNHLRSEFEYFEQRASDPRLGYIYESLLELDQNLNQQYNSQILIRYGHPVEMIPQICKQYKIEKLFFNRDYEPQAKKRDLAVTEELNKQKIAFQHTKDHVIFEHNQVRNGSGEIYRVFTPYKNKWLDLFQKHQESFLKPLKNPAQSSFLSITDLKSEITIKDRSHWETVSKILFQTPSISAGRKSALEQLKKFKAQALAQYHDNRDFPIREGTSLISTAIRHGVVSIRELVRISIEEKTSGHQIWLSELVWREFYQMLLDTHPHVKERCFKPEYDQIKWRGEAHTFKAWCEGQTGYPLVDAAMRGLNQTGQMHNRLRMVVGSFLCKTLLHDWRLGERYFALKLLDFDLAANNGGWQWCSSTGCDSQPYFRIFNPYTQSKKFDSEGEFIKLWCPELQEYSAKWIHKPDLVTPLEQINMKCQIGVDYPLAIVDYELMRKSALEMYQEIRD